MRESNYKFSLVIRNDDYIVRDHRVHKVRLMPGVTFLDMILRSIQTKGFAPQHAEFRNVLFMEPIATSEQYDRKVQITLDQKGDHYIVIAKSQKIVGKQPIDDKWDHNLQCELHVRHDVVTKTLDTEVLKQSAHAVRDMDDSYAFLRQVDIHHFIFMKSLGKIYECPEGLLAELHLSELAQKYLKSFYLHPVYLDASTIIQAVSMSRDIQAAGIPMSEIRPFIPMFIESFRASTRLNETCYVYVRNQSNVVASSKDILYYDIELYDEKGNLSALFTRLGIKQIRSAGLIQKLETVDDKKGAASAPVPTPERAALQVSAPAPAPVAVPVVSAADRNVKMQEHLRGMIAKLLESTPSEVDLESGFYDQGLDSRHLLHLVQDLEGQIGQQLYPTLLFEYTNIRELAGYLVEEFTDLFAEDITAPAVAVLVEPTPVVRAPVPAPAPVAVELPLEDMINLELSVMVGQLLDQRPDVIDIESGFYDLGLDSRHLLQLVQELEQKLGQQLYPTLLFEYTSIKELAGYLANEHASAYQARPAIAVAQVQQDDSQTCFFRRIWETADTPLVAKQGDVLIFDRDEVLHTELRARLGHESNVILVKPGSDYCDGGAGVYEINPASRESYTRLLNDLRAQGIRPTRLVNHWAQDAFAADEASLSQNLKHSIYSLFFLIQALMEQKPKDKIRILSAYYTASEAAEPHQTAVSGFARVINRENPRFELRAVELRSATALTPSQVAEVLLAEWSREEQEVEIRYEAGRRFRKRIVESHRSEATLPHVPLQQGGVYLITGGAGGLGLLFSRYIAERVQAKLVLTGRSALSADKQAQLRELEALGSEVLYVPADISKRDAVEALVHEIRTKFGPISGVIHSAGVVRDAFILEKTLQEWEMVLASKVHGTVWLDDALQADPLDFFILFSSIATLGNVGQSDYAYANAFLDAFAQKREEERKQGKRSGQTLSINWPLWKDGGMQIEEQMVKAMRERTGMAPLLNEKGLLAFETAYRLGHPVAIVIEGDHDRIAKGLGVTAPKADAAVKAQVTTAGTPAPTVAAPTSDEEIAIIGLSGRYPQARNLNEFWNNLKSGKDSITEIPAHRWDWRKDFSPDKETLGKTYAKWGGFLDDIDKFDPLFFNISPIEAEFMDPQERLFLETSWETLEDAGYRKNDLNGKKVGVFVGVMWSQYQLYGAEEALRGNNISLGGNISSIANRVSYFFNFQGPSIALDTMCSSSLTALHFAVESIKRGECEVAVAGGVNLSIHPNKYLLLAQGKFAASDGRCHAFGADGDGYVPGEGVGAVLLKPLSKAVADGDQIYAVIKSTAINHGGKASGYYVPNPTSQGNVVVEALQKAGVDPRTLSYVEAHGTGTSLGDPIEISGLMRAFSKAGDKQYCAIGSVKSNIGHLESAAGIAGLTKILLQMKYRQLVPSLHADPLNPNIPFTTSAFTVQRELAEWKQPVVIENGVAKTHPRRAGLSSFGAGGSNAHVIVEEYVPAPIAVTPAQPQQIVVLSARNTDRLRDYVKALHDFVTTAESDVRLEDIAYTLQTGREMMEERIAFVASNLQELTEQLTACVEGKTTITHVFTGNVRKGREKTELILDGREGEQFLRIIIADKKLAKLAKLWVNGVNMDWTWLHDQPQRRISLPTYPFAKERYWIPQLNPHRTQVGGTPKLHPLVERNTSTFAEQKFTTAFDGTEFVFRDHVINGQKLLPGVAYVEIARAAAELAGETGVGHVSNVIWSSPIIAEAHGVELSVSLNPTEDGAEFDVWTLDASGERVIHSSGMLAFAEETPVTDRFDMQTAIQRCGETISADEVYAGFANIGFAYGSGLRAIRAIHASAKEAVSRLELPAELQADSGRYTLHPSLMDGALQTVAALLRNRPGSSLPLAIGAVEIFRPLTASCYAHVELLEASANASITKFNLQLVSESGEVLVRIKEFAVKFFQQESSNELMELLHQIEQGALKADEADKLMEAMKP